MLKTFPTFDLEIDHLFPSEPAERKQKKEEQQRFACIDVTKLDDLVEGAEAKTTKANKICNKIRSKRFSR